VDFEWFAREAVRVFDNHYLWESDPFLGKIMPLQSRKTGLPRTAGEDSDCTLLGRDIHELFECLKILGVPPEMPMLAVPVGCPFTSLYAPTMHVSALNTGDRSGHAVLFDNNNQEPLRAAAALHIRW
jgi:hypothetical protein